MLNKKKKNIKKILAKKFKKLPITIIGIIISLAVCFPLLWLFFNSFKEKSEILDIPPTLFPKNFTLGNYKDLFILTQFGIYFRNSFFVSIFASTISVIIALLGVYGLSRFKIKFSGVISFVLLVSYMLPQVLLIIPFLKMLSTLNLTNNLFSLAFVFISMTLPFSVWMLRSYIESIPIALEEAAMVDGSSRFGSFYRIVIPAAFPGIISTFVFTFILSWNEYVYTLVLISSESKKTITLGLTNLIGGSMAVYSWGMLSAGCVLTVVPIIILFVLVQKNLIGGFSAGAIKG